MIVSAAQGLGGVRIVLESEEAMLLAEFAGQVVTVLEQEAHTDPALDRLFPDAYVDDDRASEEFRRYTREDLAQSKRDAAAAVRDATQTEEDRGIVDIELDQAASWGWLTFLTDLRLILAERTGIIADEPDDAEPVTEPITERDGYMRAAYEWVGFVQGSMLEVLDPTNER
ncbi:hypothetical protein ARHIZOSPH14_16430 [Agromyces rhizosphaerae]|uniref:DUF2017 family protein n=1 Tax=Agromyces rhizosphaerae TaxID=88374 RepID=A0A9W6CR84_9MICO|nr:DUF2017 family protein [Agromyces rhizosphaerae]GLI27401.1 hypothetical protein ARHIZOSPH14_16430 [Agromyces rhizosphaerae]